MTESCWCFWWNKQMFWKFFVCLSLSVLLAKNKLNVLVSLQYNFFLFEYLSFSSEPFYKKGNLKHTKFTCFVGEWVLTSPHFEPASVWVCKITSWATLSHLAILVQASSSRQNKIQNIQFLPIFAKDLQLQNARIFHLFKFLPG